MVLARSWLSLLLKNLVDRGTTTASRRRSMTPRIKADTHRKKKEKEKGYSSMIFNSNKIKIKPVLVQAFSQTS